MRARIAGVVAHAADRALTPALSFLRRQRALAFVLAAAPAGESLFTGIVLGRPLILLPGCRVIGFADGDATGADHTVTLNYTVDAFRL